MGVAVCVFRRSHADRAQATPFPAAGGELTANGRPFITAPSARDQCGQPLHLGEPQAQAQAVEVEVAPDGTLARLETLWATSTVVEQRARKAIDSMPPLPPTPTGKPLIFDRTITFSPFASDGPPLYRDDCLPDPPAFCNPFAWDGRSPQAWAEPASVEKPDPQALEECLKQLPQDSVDAEVVRDRRLMEQWGSGKPAR